MEVCSMHGGKSAKGIASATLRSGRYSRYLPERLHKSYKQARRDGELLSLREEVALIDTFLAERLLLLDTGEAGAVWLSLRKAWHRYQAVRGTEFEPGALDDVGALIEQGAADYLARVEVQSLLQQRRKLAESERKRLVEMQQMITATEATVLIMALTESVRRHVNDRTALLKIADDFGRLLGPGSPTLTPGEPQPG
jgi:hypothetical protein